MPKKWFYNKNTKEETLADFMPEGFIEGRLPYNLWPEERKKSYRIKKASHHQPRREYKPRNQSLNNLKPEGFYCIYKTTNKINGKTYIGQHKYTNENDPLGPYCGSGRIIKKAIKKYGKENFSVEVLYSRIRDAETCDAMEVWTIEKYKPEYNISSGGQGHTGWYRPHSKGKIWWTNDEDEVLAFECPIGWHKGRHLVLTDEARAKCASMKGKKHTEETKKRMSEHNGMKRADVREKVSKASKGRKPSAKCIEAIKKANIGRPSWNKGKHIQYSEEWYEKQKNKDMSPYKTDEFRLACSKRTKQLVWINNGDVNRRIHQLLPIPDGWVRGRLNAFGDFNKRGSK